MYKRSQTTIIEIRNPTDFLGFIASTQLHNIRGKQQGEHQIKIHLRFLREHVK